MAISQTLCASTDCIIVSREAVSRQQIIKELGSMVLKKGFITEEFIQNVLDREEEFPTGLEFEVPVAIPHIGVYCNRSFIALATLKSPVVFNSMDCSGKELPVDIVVMFGITNPDDQVETLKKFIFAFRKPENLKKLKEAKDPVQALNILNMLLDNCLDISV